MYRYKLAAVACRDVGVQTDPVEFRTPDHDTTTADGNGMSSKAELTRLQHEKQVSKTECMAYTSMTCV